MKYVLYCAFGKQRYIDEAIYSALSFLRVPGHEKDGIKVVIMSDKIDLFKPVFEGNSSVILDDVPGSVFKEWVGEAGFTLRLKIRALQYFFRKYRENVLFIDSDTIVLKNIEHFFDIVSRGQFVMDFKCVNVGRIEEITRDIDPDSLFGNVVPRIKLCREIKETNSISDGQRRFEVPLSFHPHNSGIIGMNMAYEHILEDAVALADLIFKKYEYWLAEEFAFSYVFQKVSSIVTQDGEIYHYPEAKFCRCLQAKVLGYTNEDIENEMKAFIEKFGIRDLEAYKMTIEDVPVFATFLLYFLQMHSIQQDKNIMLEFATYRDTSKTPFFDAYMMRYRKFYAIWSAQKKAQKSEIKIQS